MSKHLVTITDRKDLENILSIYSFYGGDKDKKCIQLTLEKNYTQLDKNRVKALISALQEWLKED